MEGAQPISSHPLLPSQPSSPRPTLQLSANVIQQEVCSAQRQEGRGRQDMQLEERSRERAASSPEAESSSPDIRLRIALLGHNVKHVTLNSKVILHKEPQVKDFSVLRAVPVTIVENVEKKQQ